MELWTPAEQELGVWIDCSEDAQLIESPENTGLFLAALDKSGKNRHFSRSIFFPSLDTQLVNGMHGLKFSTNQVLKVAGWTSGMNHVFAAVVTPPTSGDRRYLWHGSSAIALLNNTGKLGYYSGQEWQGDVAPLAGPQILVWILNNDEQTGIIRRNGATVFQGLYRGWDNQGDVTDDGFVEIGGRSSLSNWSMSTIFEIVKLDDIPSDPIIEKLEGYLAHKWGLVPALEVSHPFKNEPPTIDVPATASKVAGIVQIEGSPARRTVRAFGYDPATHDIDGITVSQSKSLGQAVSDEVTGEYSIDLLDGYASRIFVVAFDDYGLNFNADMAVALGDRVHPTAPNGHVFECLGSGTLPSEEPAWIIDTETPQLYGTASMIARPFYRPMVHGPVVPELVDLWLPSGLYDTGAVGFCYLPADISTLYQDAAATIPVTQSGDPVGCMLDKSGNGFHAKQTTSSRRPIYRSFGGYHWLEFRNNAFLVASNVDLSIFDKFAAIAAIRKDSSNVAGMMLEFGSAYNTPGSFYMYAPGSDYELSMFGGSQVKRLISGYPAPSTNVISAIMDFGQLATAEMSARVDGEEKPGVASGSDNTANFGTNSLYIGSRAGSSLYFNGDMFGVIAVAGGIAEQDVVGAENYLAQRAQA